MGRRPLRVNYDVRMPEPQPQPQPQARHAATSRRLSRRARVLISIATALAVIVAGTGITALIVRYQINSNINHVEVAFPVLPDVPSATAEPQGEPPIDFLVLGSDSRTSGGDPSEWVKGGQNSDAMMLVQISGDRQSVTVMSIPRDSWVPIEGHGEGKINWAFSYGGPELAISTVQNLTGVTIDHFAVMDFTSFKELTDALGGVTITTATGDQRMNGEQAFWFVHDRFTVTEGDLDRVRRQQAWMKGILSEVFNKDVLKSPAKVASLISIVLQYSAVDQGINFDYLAGLAVQVKDLRPGSVQFLTAPHGELGFTVPGRNQWVLRLDYAKLDPFMEAWRDDKVVEYLKAHPKSIPKLEDRPVE